MEKLLYLILIFAMAATPALKAEEADTTYTPIYERVYSTDWAIDTTQVHQLRLQLNSTAFFRDNEFDNSVIRGYTLPGFRLNPTLTYKPNPYVNVEAGVYMLRFWGTDEYPNLAYTDIASWTGLERANKGLHALPFFRVQFATRGGLNLVLGSIYGARYHNLIEPLYAPELNLTADPEAGVQILYSNRWLDFDAWVNWESFIYKGDTHQEAFTFGVSAALKYNSRKSPVHLYTPVQVLFQHRGGEIDTLLTNSVQTLFNGSVGIGARIDINHRAIHSLTLQADLLGYNQQVGDIWPLKRGWAYFVHGHLDVAHVRLRAGYYHSNKFLSLFGYPFFGNMSLSSEGLTFDSRSTLFTGMNFNYRFAPGYSLGINAEIYRHFATDGMLNGAPARVNASTSFAGSIYVSLNPSFLLKSLK